MAFIEYDDCKELVFISNPYIEHRGAFITRVHFDFLSHFGVVVRGHPDTFEDFWRILGDEYSSYVKEYVGSWDDFDPKPEDSFDRVEELWFYYDEDFPLLQTFEESYPIYKGILIEHEGERHVTEYGREWAMYPITEYANMKTKLESFDFNVVNKVEKSS